jgi:hypothetical protein
MHSALRELPRRGRGRSQEASASLQFDGWQPDSRVGRRHTVRGSSIRQSIRLLTEGLRVRVPPPELEAGRWAGLGI